MHASLQWHITINPSTVSELKDTCRLRYGRTGEMKRRSLWTRSTSPWCRVDRLDSRLDGKEPWETNTNTTGVVLICFQTSASRSHTHTRENHSHGNLRLLLTSDLQNQTASTFVMWTFCYLQPKFSSLQCEGTRRNTRKTHTWKSSTVVSWHETLMSQRWRAADRSDTPGSTAPVHWYWDNQQRAASHSRYWPQIM